LALVRDGDIISLDVEAGTLDLEVPDAELTARKRAWKKPETLYTRGYTALYQERVTQADKGCDFDFLSADDPTPEPEIF
jgi:dihydroxy-acid dehydratase